MRNPLLLEPAGRRLVLVAAVGNLASGLAQVALPWIVLEDGGGAALAGLVATAGLLAYVLLATVAGAVGDRPGTWRRLLPASQLGQALAAAAIPLAAFAAGTVPLALVFAVALAIGGIRSFADASLFAALTELVPPAALGEANAAMSAASSTGSVTGPFLAGTLVAVVGGPGTVAMQSLAFAAAAALALAGGRGLAGGAAPPAAAAAGSRAATAGLVAIWRIANLRALSAITVAWFAVMYSAESFLVPFYREELGMSAGRIGVVMGVSGVVGLAGSLAVGPLMRRIGSGAPLVLAGIAASGLAAVAISQAGAVSVLAIAPLLAVAVDLTTTSSVSERQRHAPQGMQARVGVAGRTLLFTGGVVGGFALSGLASLVSLRTLFLVAGAATLAIAPAGILLLRRAARATSAAPAALVSDQSLRDVG